MPVWILLLYLVQRNWYTQILALPLRADTQMIMLVAFISASVIKLGFDEYLSIESGI